MTTKNKDEISISPEDRELFRNTVKNSVPLKENKKQYFKKKPIAKARFTQIDQRDVLTETLDCDIEDQEKSTSAFLRSLSRVSISSIFSPKDFSINSIIFFSGITP